jgi:hypothetical protein
MNNDFIIDYWNILIEKLQELEVEFKNSENEDFIKVQVMSFYDAASILRDQLDAFGIVVDEIKNKDIEKYLFLK